MSIVAAVKNIVGIGGIIACASVAVFGVTAVLLKWFFQCKKKK